MNLYEYCHNNPVVYVDPSGNKAISLCPNAENKAGADGDGKSGSGSDRHYDFKNKTKYEKITDYLKGKKQKYKGDKLMYSVKNKAGDDVVVSKKPIYEDSFLNILDYYQRQGKDVVILSGTHGTPNGLCSRSAYPLCYEPQFFNEDCVTAKRFTNVKVYDVSKLTEAQFESIINSSDVTICAWCYSERSVDVINVINE